MKEYVFTTWTPIANGPFEIEIAAKDYSDAKAKLREVLNESDDWLLSEDYYVARIRVPAVIEVVPPVINVGGHTKFLHDLMGIGRGSCKRGPHGKERL